jgi:hypothetical protein
MALPGKFCRHVLLGNELRVIVHRLGLFQKAGVQIFRARTESGAATNIQRRNRFGVPDVPKRAIHGAGHAEIRALKLASEIQMAGAAP